MTGMLELSMATMYKDAMSKAVEDDFEKAVRNYYARSIKMEKSWNSLKEDRDEAMHQAQQFWAEGLCKNALLKETLVRAQAAEGSLKELKRRYEAADEARLNNQELYEIATDEAPEAVKAQGTLKHIIEHMEAEQLPQKIKIAEMESLAKAKEEAYQALEKQHKSLQEDN